MSLSAKMIPIIFAITWLSTTSAAPFESLKIKPLSIRAPVSYMHQTRGVSRHNSIKIDSEPHSFIIRRSSHAENTILSDRAEPVNDREEDERLALPSLVSVMVRHPIPKSLEISYNPHLSDAVTNLKISDAILDAVSNIATAFPKIEPTTTTTTTTTTRRPNRRPTSTRRPRPQRPRPPRPQRPQRPTQTTKQIEDKMDLLGEEDIPQLTSSTSTTTNTPQPVRPQNNHLAGQSQIGNRESQMVIKPTVIVNIRGTVSNSDSEIKVESRAEEDDNSTAVTVMPQNVFHINQEVNIENTYSIDDEAVETKKVGIKSKRAERFIDIFGDDAIDEVIEEDILENDRNDDDEDNGEDVLPEGVIQSVIYELKVIESPPKNISESINTTSATPQENTV